MAEDFAPRGSGPDGPFLSPEEERGPVWEPPRRALLPDGRLHLQDGPIDLVLGLEGTRQAVQQAREAAWRALHGVQAALALELPVLRAPLLGQPPALHHPVARRMAEAAWPHRAQAVTPMMAMSGACAEHVMRAVATIPDLALAHVRQGGDVALYLAGTGSLRVALGATVPGPLAVIRDCDPVRGLATVGWPGGRAAGGIADAVTVLAECAPEAAAAARILVQAADEEHAAAGGDPETVLAAGRACAERLLAKGLILGACLGFQGRVELVGLDRFLLAPDRAAPLRSAGRRWAERKPAHRLCGPPRHEG